MAVQSFRKVKRTTNSIVRKLFGILSREFEIDILSGETDETENAASIMVVEGAKLVAQITEFVEDQTQEIEKIKATTEITNKEVDRLFDAIEILRKNQQVILQEIKTLKETKETKKETK